ncbi:alpha/beta hydrolase-fold protein [Paenibacillus sediminis]|uniref:Enterochelin esterase-like enzyme n=1 Tax=Paenibacillus sediminis TaxID=664909 RepID=A0ABS4H3D1_9BACL|nr:alpha/beta hydrolase-fold protein [Paenibacillus sediminis]MBP1937033.1 enterochelin esterase-like enzyme [Paenibacillus sediminis]
MWKITLLTLLICLIAAAVIRWHIVSNRTAQLVTIASFPSNHLEKERDLYVYTPPGYKFKFWQRYPVLYMQDGQNLFTETHGGSSTKWGLKQSLDRLIAEGKLEPIIVVGISNTSDRLNEYAPTHIERPGLSAGGKADAYINFIIKECKPYIDGHYRTKPNAEHTGVVGSSLGGLVSFYAGWNHPETFSRIGAVSPSFWWDDKYMERIVRQSSDKKPLRMWIDIGTAEETSDRDNDGIIDAVDDARSMIQALQEKGYKPGSDFRYYEEQGGVHNESAWAGRIDDILLGLYGKEHHPRPVKLEVKGWDKIPANYPNPIVVFPTLTYDNGLHSTPLAVTYRSSDEHILKASSDGRLSPVGKGTVTLTIEADGIVLDKPITVK